MRAIWQRNAVHKALEEMGPVLDVILEFVFQQIATPVSPVQGFAKFHVILDARFELEQFDD